MNGPRIIVFAKAPVAGAVKTRLIPALGADGAARLAARLLRHTVEQACRAAPGKVELCASPAYTDPAWHGHAIDAGVALSDQGAGDLGQRMARAAYRATECGDAVILVGTDCPALDAQTLALAGAALRAHDAVMIPATDGGYVLLGLRRMHASLFEGIAWSTAGVGAATLARIAALDWTVACLPALHDIDLPADLHWLPPGLA